MSDNNASYQENFLYINISVISIKTIPNNNFTSAKKDYNRKNIKNWRDFN
jgi:hypothetical protein